MKIWFQTVSSLDRRPEYLKTLTQFANSAADPGTVVECHGTTTGVGGEEYNSVRYFDVTGLLANAITAERKGFDAFVIGNTLDAGLREARELVNIPVISHMQTSLMMMSMMAGKFSLIVSHYRFAPIWEGLIREYGFRDRMVSIDALDIEVTQGERLYTDKQYEEMKLQRVVDLAKKAVAGGAELIIIFPPSMFLRLAKQGMLDIDGAPVLNTIAAVIRMAELMVKYRKVTGMFISRKLVYSSPPKDLVDQVIARHKLQIGG